MEPESVGLCVWLLPLRTCGQCTSRGSVCQRAIPFPCQVRSLCLHQHTSFVHVQRMRTSGLFLLFDCYNNAAVNTHAHISERTDVFVSLGYGPRTPGSNGDSTSDVLRTCQTICPSSGITLHPQWDEGPSRSRRHLPPPLSFLWPSSEALAPGCELTAVCAASRSHLEGKV